MTTNQEGDLKCCPFCRCKGEPRRVKHSPKGFYIECGCGARGNPEPHPERAVGYWNYLSEAEAEALKHNEFHKKAMEKYREFVDLVYGKSESK